MNNALTHHDETLDSHSLLAENLAKLFKAKQVNIMQMAKTLKMPDMTIRRLLSGETQDPRISTLQALADYLGVGIEALFCDNLALPIQSEQKGHSYRLPVLDWQTIGNMTAKTLTTSLPCQRWQTLSLEADTRLSPHAFALESQPSMYPRFPKNTIFIIDPDTPPHDGDTVLVKIKADHAATLRELSVDPPVTLFKPIVPTSEPLRYCQSEHEILGVNVLTLLYNWRLAKRSG